MIRPPHTEVPIRLESRRRERSRTRLGKYGKPQEGLPQCPSARFDGDPETDTCMPTHRLDFAGVQVNLEPVTTRIGLVRGKAIVCLHTNLLPKQSVRTPTLQPTPQADHYSPRNREHCSPVKNLLSNAWLRFCVILEVDFAFVLAIAPMPLLLLLGLKTTLARGTLTSRQRLLQTAHSFDARPQSAPRSAS